MILTQTTTATITTKTTSNLYFIYCLLLLSFLSRATFALQVSFNHSNIRYFGQWTTDIDQNALASRWPGAYFKLALQNTSHVQLKFTKPTRIMTRLDNGPNVYYETTGNDDMINLTPHGQELDVNTIHPLVVMATEIEPTSLSLLSFQSIDIDQQGKLVLPQQDNNDNASIIFNKKVVEFIGHDLVLGVGTSKTLFTSFAYLTADALGTDYGYVATRDARLVGELEDDYFNYSSDYSSNSDGIVILLGANDKQQGGEVGSNDTFYYDSLCLFLQRTRSLPSNKNVPIFVLSEPLGDMYHPSQQAVLDMSHKLDHIYFVDTTAWLRYGPTYYLNWSHLNDIGHAMLAKKLSPLLQIKLANPRDPLPGPPPNPNLPGAWQTMDVGEESRIGLPGTVSADSSSTFTLWGSGADIDNQRDAFRFVYQAFSDQGGIETTVRSHSAFASCAKAGIMVREHFGHGSPLIMLGISPAEGIFVQVRYGNFEPTKLIKKMRASAPYRLALVRKKDNVFEARIQHIIDEDGSSGEWEVFATIPFVIAKDVYAGLAVTSCDISVVSVAKFTEVSIYQSVSSDGSLRLINQQ